MHLEDTHAPQHQALPSAANAQACSLPTLTVVQLSGVSTVWDVATLKKEPVKTGVGVEVTESDTVPGQEPVGLDGSAAAVQPIRPWKLLPQQYYSFPHSIRDTAQTAAPSSATLMCCQA